VRALTRAHHSRASVAFDSIIRNTKDTKAFVRESEEEAMNRVRTGEMVNRGPSSGASPSGRTKTVNEGRKTTTTTSGPKAGRAPAYASACDGKSELDEFLGGVEAPVELTHGGRSLDTDLSLLNSFAVPRMSSFSFQSLGSQSIVENELATAAADAMFDVFTSEMYARGASPYTNTSTPRGEVHIPGVPGSVNDVFEADAFEGFTHQMFGVEHALRDGISGFSVGDYPSPITPDGGAHLVGADRHWNEQPMHVPLVYQQQLTQQLAHQHQHALEQRVNWNPTMLEWYTDDIGLDVTAAFGNSTLKAYSQQPLQTVNSPSRDAVKRARTSGGASATKPSSKINPAKKTTSNKQTTSGARKPTSKVSKKSVKAYKSIQAAHGTSAQNFASISGSLSDSTRTRFRLPGSQPTSNENPARVENTPVAYDDANESESSLVELQKIIKGLRPTTRENIKCSLLRLVASTKLRGNESDILPIGGKDENLIDRSVANVLYHRYSDISPSSTPNPEAKDKMREKESDSNSSRDSKDGFFETGLFARQM